MMTATAPEPGAATFLHSDFIDEKTLARRLNVSVGLVRKWRFHGTGPRYYKFGAAVRYHNTDVTDYLKNALVETRQAA